MIILGKSKEDVGAQLERLTKRLLENRGYKNVTTNVITDGGNEVDIQADFPSPVPTNPNSRRLIAECKAWAIPISLPDLLKFLGKVFVEEARLGNEVDGLYVSLSGVNGPVRGHYDSLSQRRKNITLLEGETLTQEVSGLYKLPQAAVVVAKLKSLTEKQYSSLGLAYYAERFFWLFRFDGGDIAVLNANGDPAEAKIIAELEASILDRMQGQKILDLRAEREARERKRKVEKYLISMLFKENGSLADVFVDQDQEGFSSFELKDSTKQAESNGWLTQSGKIISLQTNDPAKILGMFRFILEFEISSADWTRIAASQLFKSLLNDDFLKSISAIQGNLIFGSELGTKILMLIAISPSALAYAINPDPLIVTHRIEQPEAKYEEAHDVGVFMRTLLRLLRQDFRHRSLAQFFYATGFREVEVIERVKIKDTARILLEHETKQRTLLAMGDATLGGGLLLVEALSNAPEPWDLFKGVKKAGS